MHQPFWSCERQYNGVGKQNRLKEREKRKKKEREEKKMQMHKKIPIIAQVSMGLFFIDEQMKRRERFIV